jgi:site-specific DNA recombinase
MKTPIAPSSVTKNVGIWIRVSTEDQARGESPQHHEQRAREYAKFNRWTVKEVYDLAGVSGKTVMDHPEARRMLSDIRKGHITGLIFSKLARLARNTRELLDFADIFRQHNADMISLQEKIDTSTPAGRLFYTMIAAMAQWEREEIADRVRASVSVRAKLGKPLGGNSPYGYIWRDRQLVQAPAEVSIRRRVYELFAEHRRKGVVARLLNDAGYRTRKGCKWSDITVGRTLRCPSAKGIYYLNRTRQNGTWNWELKPETEWGTIRVEPIVSEALWNQCNEILEEQLKKEKRPGKKPVQLFAGLAFCSCGHKMYVKSNSPKYVCTKCRNKIPIVDLEAIIHDELKAYFGSHEAIAKHLEEANQNCNEKERLLQAHKNEIQKLRDEMTRTHRLYLDGEVTAQGFGQFYKPAEERLNQLLAELPKLEAEIDHLKVSNLSAEEVVTEAEALYERWPTLPVESRRSVVESIVEKITIGKDEIDITLAYMPVSEEMANSQQALPRRRGPVRRPSRSFPVGRSPFARWRPPYRWQSANRSSALPF